MEKLVNIQNQSKLVDITQDDPQKYIYHYTTAQNLLNILDSMEFWLFNVQQQQDIDEIHYAGNICSSFTINEFMKSKNPYLGIQGYVIAKYFGNDDNTLNITKTIDTIPEENIIRKVITYMDELDIKFFIGSFSLNQNNLYLRENYQDKSSGVIIKFDLDKIKRNIRNIGIKQVVYYQDEDVNEFLISNLSSTKQKYFELLLSNSDMHKRKSAAEYLKWVTHLVISTKQKKFLKEEELRLIIQSDKAKFIKNKPKKFNGREYISLFANRDHFKNCLSELIFCNLSESQIKQVKQKMRLRNLKFKINYLED